MECAASPGSFHGAVLVERQLAGLRLVERRYAPGQRTPRHAHEHAYVGLVLEGHSRQVCGGRELDRGPMTALLCPPGETHCEQFGAATSRIFSVELDAPRFARLGCSPAGLHSRSGRFAWLAARLYDEFRCDDDVAELAIEGLVLELLAAVARDARAPSRGRAPRWLDRARELLDARFDERLSLAALAAAVGVHPVYLSAQFRRRFGVTVGDYVRRLRIEFACRELATSDTPIATIALAAGFANQAHFSRTFKRITGVTPQHYRRAPQRP